MLAYWPGSIAPGGKVDEVVSTLDLTATMAHAAGIDDRPETQFHGVSLLSRLLGHRRRIDRLVIRRQRGRHARSLGCHSLLGVGRRAQQKLERPRRRRPRGDAGDRR